jgi:LPXTG-motif cell wall-anchored protein
LWKVITTTGGLQLLHVTSLQPEGSTITESVSGNEPGVQVIMRQSIPGTHGKGTATIELQGSEISHQDPPPPPITGGGTVDYNCTATLPVTGTGSMTYVAAGGALVVGGVGLVLLARRRRSRTST